MKRRDGYGLTLVLSVAGLGTVASCAFLPPFQFNAQARAIEAEASIRFPAGSRASGFEAWFRSQVELAGPGSAFGFSPQTQARGRTSCESRTMVLRRAEGCMNQLIAEYCVAADGKLAELKFAKNGYC